MSNKKNYSRYKSMLNKVYTLQFINSAKSILPRGQVKYHMQNYQKYYKFSKKCGLKPLTKVPKTKNLSYCDSVPLRVGFVKKENIKKMNFKNYFTKPINEFKENKNIYVKKASSLALKILEKKKRLSKKSRIDIFLKLFEIRANYNHKKTKDKYIALIDYFKKIIKDNSKFYYNV